MKISAMVPGIKIIIAPATRLSRKLDNEAVIYGLPLLTAIDILPF